MRKRTTILMTRRRIIRDEKKTCLEQILSSKLLPLILMCPDQYWFYQAVSGEVSINTSTRSWSGTISGFNDYGWESGTPIE